MDNLKVLNWDQSVDRVKHSNHIVRTALLSNGPCLCWYYTAGGHSYVNVLLFFEEWFPSVQCFIIYRLTTQGNL